MHFPPLPSWDAMHPLIIHFPIVLLLLTPLFVLIASALRPPGNRAYMIAALITLLLGTLSIFLAASSGEEAAELADHAGGSRSHPRARFFSRFTRRFLWAFSSGNGFPACTRAG